MVCATRNRLSFDYDEIGLRIKKHYQFNYRRWVGDDINEPDAMGGGETEGIEEVEDDGSASDTTGGYELDYGTGGHWEHYTVENEWHYLYDGSTLIAVFDAQDSIRYYYVNGPGGQVASYHQNITGRLDYYLKDHLGSNRVAVRDSTGTGGPPLAVG